MIFEKRISRENEIEVDAGGKLVFGVFKMKNILSTLAFYASNPGWQTFAKKHFQINAIKSLEKRGFLEVSWGTSQARFSGKVFADR